MAITHHGIELDLENNIYWLQEDKLEKLPKEELSQFSVGQKLDVRELLQRGYASNLSDIYFGFAMEVFDCEDDELEDVLNGVLETTVTGIARTTVQIEYFRYEKCSKRLISVEGSGQTNGYMAAMPSGVLWDVNCFFRDTFVLKGAARELVKEKDFCVRYKPNIDAESLTIWIGSMDLHFDYDNDMADHYWNVDVLGLEIEEKVDCTIVKVDLRAFVCAAGLNKSDGYNPYD